MGVKQSDFIRLNLTSPHIEKPCTASMKICYDLKKNSTRQAEVILSSKISWEEEGPLLAGYKNRGRFAYFLDKQDKIERFVINMRARNIRLLISLN